MLSASTPDDTLATKVVVTVNVPPGLTLTGTTSTRGSGCGPLTGGVLSCSLDFLSAGACKTGTITIGATIAQPGEHVLRATLASASGERNAADNTIELRVSTPATAPPVTSCLGSDSKRTRHMTGTYGREHSLRGISLPRTRCVGLGGNDSLYGAAGNDRLFGGSGNDRLFGGLGNVDLLESGIWQRRNFSSRDRARDTHPLR